MDYVLRTLSKAEASTSEMQGRGGREAAHAKGNLLENMCGLEHKGWIQLRAAKWRMERVF